MRVAALLLVAGALLSGATACTPSGTQTASNGRCRQFALSGGYPILRGGSVYGPNSNLLELPGEPPLWIGGFGEPGVQAHLDEQAYLERWCMKNMGNEPAL